MRRFQVVVATAAIAGGGYVALGSSQGQKMVKEEDCPRYVELLRKKDFSGFDVELLRAGVRQCVREGTLTHQDVADLSEELGEIK